MEKPEEMLLGKQPTALTYNDIDLSVYDEECLKRDILVVEIKGVRLPVWRVIESVLWVKDQDTHLPVKFHMRWAQKRLYQALLEQALNGKRMRQDILKARQLGFSTLIASIFFVLGMFKPYTKWCVMADKKEHAQNIFKMYQFFYRHLDDSLNNIKEIREFERKNPGKIHPSSLKPLLSHEQAGKVMATAENESEIEVIVAGEGAGRSASYTGVHSSETGFQKNIDDTNTALFATVSPNDKDSMIFIETTANGYNDYKERWDKDSTGKTSFNPLFIAWYTNKDYSIPCDVLPQLDTWMYEKWEKHPEITKEQMMWYWVRYCDGYNESKMKQEYPFDPEDAFISSGKSVFDMSKLKTRLDYLLSLPKYWESGDFGYDISYSVDGLTIVVSKVAYCVTESGYWQIYKRPISGRHYVVICDPSKGMNYDYSAIQVLDQNTGEQQAYYSAKEDIDEVAKQLYCAGVYYNNALLSCEANTGSTITDLLVKMNYPNLYVDQNPVYNDFNQSYSRRYGHMTTIATRQPMIDSFVIAFRENPKIIWSIETLQEMEKFQIVASKVNGGETKYKAQASGANAHDDAVMAYVPFWMVRTQQSFDLDEDKRPAGGVKFDSYDAYIAYLHKQESESHEERGKVANRLGFSW